MTRNEFKTCWAKLTSLWPNWKANTGLEDAWMGVLMGWPFDVAIKAIDEHWQNKADGYGPDPKAVKKLCHKNKDQSISPEQAKLLEAWPKMTKLEQCRYARDSYAAQADKCQDEKEAAELRFKASLYADHAARLYRLHADDVPPRYGDRTLRPEPWGIDLQPKPKQPEPIGAVVGRI